MHSNLLITLLVAGLKFALPQTIDPTTVDIGTKQKWCTDQKASCPLLCLQIPGTSAATESNTCDADSLSYTCVCSNGQSPNSSQYSQTVPYYECTQSATNCVNQCTQGDTSCQSACRTAHPCGAQNPTRVNSSTISSMASTTSSGSSATGSSGASTTASGSNTFTGFGGAGATSTGTSDAPGRAQAMALGVGRTYGLAVVLTVVGAGFIFAL